MGDMIKDGMAWCLGKLNDHASSPVTYRRKDGSEIQLRAVIGLVKDYAVYSNGIIAGVFDINAAGLNQGAEFAELIRARRYYLLHLENDPEIGETLITEDGKEHEILSFYNEPDSIKDPFVEDSKLVIAGDT